MTYHIVTRQGIIIPHLEHHLLCLMQARVNDVTVNETPRFLTPEPNGETHAIIVTDPDNLAAVILPLALNGGVASCLSIFEVAMEEWESYNYPQLELTSEHIEWDPTSTTFRKQEEAITKWDGTTHDNVSAKGPI